MKNTILSILLIFVVTFSFSQENNQLTTVILIRHAEKVDDGTRDPDLSEKGLERAQLLLSKFSKSGIDAIYSSPYKRTRQTVKPLAEKFGLEIVAYDPSDKDFVQQIYEKNKGKTLIISGHSNTTTKAVNSLIGTEQYPDLDHEEYGRIFIVTIDHNRNTNVLEIQY